jgi:hypothetical protein
MIFTVPYHDHEKRTVKRADLKIGGGYTHYLPPIYHGDPMTGDNSNGALVFYDYGGDIFEMLRAAGFFDVKIICADNHAYAHYGAPYLFEAIKE